MSKFHYWNLYGTLKLNLKRSFFKKEFCSEHLEAGGYRKPMVGGTDQASHGTLSHARLVCGTAFHRVPPVFDTSRSGESESKR